MTPVRKTVQDVNFTVFAFDMTGNGFHPDDPLGKTAWEKQDAILNRIQKYDKKNQTVIVSLHWGDEYETKPKTWQEDFSKKLIDSGATIVYGHHSHVLSDPPYELYKDGIIFYSLGNFVFDQWWSQETSQSSFFIVTMDHNGSIVEKPKEIPFFLDPYTGYPQLESNALAER